MPSLQLENIDFDYNFLYHQGTFARKQRLSCQTSVPSPRKTPKKPSRLPCIFNLPSSSSPMIEDDNATLASPRSYPSKTNYTPEPSPSAHSTSKTFKFPLCIDVDDNDTSDLPTRPGFYSCPGSATTATFSINNNNSNDNDDEIDSKNCYGAYTRSSFTSDTLLSFASTVKSGTSTAKSTSSFNSEYDDEPASNKNNFQVKLGRSKKPLFIQI